LDGRIAEYTRRLKLTPAQVAAMRPYFERVLSEMEQIHGDLRAKTTTVIKEMNAQVAGVMTPEQREEFWRLLKEKAKRRQAANGTD
jgi:Spy/CpxP family protein refolding chaperone